MPSEARQKLLIIDTFDGLTNRRDTLRFHESGGNNISSAALSTAINIDVDNEGKLQKAKGFTEVNSENVSDAFATMDELKCYLIVGGVLKELLPAFNTETLYSFANVSLKHAQWLELNDRVYVSYADEHVIIERNGVVRPWGVAPPPLPTVSVEAGTMPPGQYQVATTFINPVTKEESGALGVVTFDLANTGRLSIDTGPAGPAGWHTVVYVSPTDGDALYRAVFLVNGGTATWDGPQGILAYPLRNLFLEPPPPVIDHLAFFGGRVFVAQYFPESDQTGIFWSEALQYEHFNLLDNVVFVKGEVLVMQGAREGVVIGTEDEIFGYNGDSLTKLADYGVVRGSLSTMDNGLAMVWTERGLITAFPFTEVTDPKVHVPPGVFGSAVLVEQDGYKKFVALVEDGGTAYNPSEA